MGGAGLLVASFATVLVGIVACNPIMLAATLAGAGALALAAGSK